MGDAGINLVFSALDSLNSQTKCNTWLRCCHGKALTALMRHIRFSKGEGSYVSRQSQAGCGLPSAHTSTGSARAAPHPLTDGFRLGTGNDGYTTVPSAQCQKLSAYGVRFLRLANPGFLPRRNDGYTKGAPRGTPKGHYAVGSGAGMAGGWEVDQAGPGLAPQWRATMPMFIRR